MSTNSAIRIQTVSVLKTQDVVEALQSAIVEITGIPRDQVEADDELFMSGRIDSIQVVEIMTLLEERLGGSIDESCLSSWTSLVVLSGEIAEALNSNC